MAKKMMYVRLHSTGTDRKEFNADDETQKMLAEYGWFPENRKLPPQFDKPKTDFTEEELLDMLAAKRGKKDIIPEQPGKTFIPDNETPDTTTEEFPQFEVKENTAEIPVKKTRRTKAQIQADKKHKA